MIIGIPREIKDQEYRVALLPSAAYQLIKRGHQVLVERKAGIGAGYPDSEYIHAARTATQALTNVTYRYVEMLADSGLAEACHRWSAASM